MNLPFKKENIAYLCPYIIDFDAVDLSEYGCEEVVKVTFCQKQEGNKSFELYRVTGISKNLCMQNLEMTDGNKKTLCPKNVFNL